MKVNKIVYGAFGRQVFAVQMIDAADARIRRDELVCKLSNRFHKGEFITETRRNKDFVLSICLLPNLRSRGRQSALTIRDNGAD